MRPLKNKLYTQENKIFKIIVLSISSNTISASIIPPVREISTMIPKLLHYVWISGDPLPELIQRCRKSWEKWLPDYEWVLWDRKKIEGIENNWLAPVSY